jgi:hypothetical protein
MGQERERILDLLASGKITAEEAGRLLDALETRSSQAVATGTIPEVKPTGTPKYMFVKVLSAKGDNVNVKVPLSLVRAGLKLTSFIPQPAMEQINKSMGDQGLSIDLLNFKAEDLEELIEALREMEVNVDAVNGDNVRVYCAELKIDNPGAAATSRRALARGSLRAPPPLLRPGTRSRAGSRSPARGRRAGRCW